MLGIYIHNIKNASSQTDVAGSIPLRIGTRYVISLTVYP